MARLGIAKERSSQPGFSLLRELGFNKGQIEHASDVHLRAHDGGRLRRIFGAASADLRLRESLRARRQSLHRGARASAHDGRGSSRSSPARSPRR
jgi:hypothetical protein